MMFYKENWIYQICNIPVQITKINTIEKETPIWNRFVVEDRVKTELFLYVKECVSVSYQVEKYEIQEGAERVFRYGSDVLIVNGDWSKCTLLQPKDPSSFLIFTNHMFYSRAVHHRMIQCHSALVDWNGSGILFLGPSGIGKTTQAERWAQYRGADIINGDLVFIQESEDGFLGWGTPWHGSSPYCINRAVPLKALVILKQSKENRIRELTGFEKVREVSDNVFYPTWLDDGMELCTEVLNNLLLQLPVYRLDNRADEEAVEMLEQVIKTRE